MRQSPLTVHVNRESLPSWSALLQDRLYNAGAVCALIWAKLTCKMMSQSEGSNVISFYCQLLCGLNVRLRPRTLLRLAALFCSTGGAVTAFTVSFHCCRPDTTTKCIYMRMCDEYICGLFRNLNQILWTQRDYQAHVLNVDVGGLYRRNHKS